MEFHLGSVLVIGGCGLVGHTRYVNGSISSKQDVLTALKESKTDVIINTASPNSLIASKHLLEEVNITGTQNVLDCAMECGIKVCVHTSSSEVVQNSYDDIIWANETWPLPECPVDGGVYARTKKIGEDLVLKANGKNGLLTAAIRLSTVFGEDDQFRVGTGKNLYDFIYAGNAAEGHILAAKKLVEASLSKEPVPKESRVDGEAFFLTNGDPWPFWDFSRFVAAEIGLPIADKDLWFIPLGIAIFVLSPSITTRMLKYTAEVRTFDITKAKQRLGYRPRVGMEEGIKRAVASALSRSNTSEQKKST
ncbi:putative sterol-4-alpha-carboxylate 3-dehydrogenase, decarboxylating [Mytilinidion resinicola]|uniref:Sterol-4-alpha-carboxylate 3-dehydrogenase, decarboxylating n=1 Tax=Mytilinidion resinicola TaxID=574789 RepID=A0A6A6YG14_9PEZI|nr:putative sterol-4-alpha-carboxylate 3-dehydrogenase, decarboxylating [Mytilinidion resinicola]KAF2807473.1 putative sterol-4-alpha-carboxylate 3-dehydrogenase, decarboxylating [Mytilinidion resinicola]